MKNKSFILAAIALMFLSAPVPAQETSGGFAGGSILIGSDNRACTAALKGSIRYNSMDKVPEACNGVCWKPFTGSSGLIAHWRLDESAGTIVSDSGCGGYDGDFVSTPVWQPAGGQVAGALDFDGALDYVRVPYDAALTPAQFTVALWAKTDVAENNSLFKGAGGNGWNHGHRIILNGAGTAVFAHCDDGTVNGLTAVATPFPLATWAHVAMTYDGTGLKVYLDGVWKATDTTGACGYDVNDDLFIGHTHGYEEFDGRIDDVRLYNRALTATEITALYDATK